MKSQLLFITCLLCSVVRRVSFQYSGFYFFEDFSLKCSSEKVSSPRPGKACSARGSSPSLWASGWELAGGLRFLGCVCRPGPCELSEGEVCTRPSPDGLLPGRTAGACSSRSHPAASSGPACRPPPVVHGPRLLNTQLGRFSEGAAVSTGGHRPEGRRTPAGISPSLSFRNREPAGEDFSGGPGVRALRSHCRAGS